MRRITGELAEIAEMAMHDATAVIRNARLALRSAAGPRRGRLVRAINHLDTMLQRTQRVVAQTRSRLAELEQLERAIGKTGLLAVRPLMMATGKEIWQLTLLRQ